MVSKAAKYATLRKKKRGVFVAQFVATGENIYRLSLPYKDIYTTVVVLVSEHGNILFDTASTQADIQEQILPAYRALGLEAPENIFISHNHGDHSGAHSRQYGANGSTLRHVDYRRLPAGVRYLRLRSLGFGNPVGRTPHGSTEETANVGHPHHYCCPL